MVKVFKSTIIDAPLERVWAVLRDFNSHDRWHPAIAYSEIEDGRASDEVGCVRRFRLRDGGGWLREQLLALSDRDHAFTYCILAAPLPLDRYVATVTLKAVTDGMRTLWVWRSEFDPPPDRAAELATLVGDGIYEAGFRSLRALLGADHAPSDGPTSASPAADRTVSSASSGAAPVISPQATATGGHRPIAGGATTTGRAIVLRRYGGPDALHEEPTAAPPPGPGEARIRQTAIGVNFIDVYCRTGYFPLLAPPAVPGMEAAGEVIDIGPGVYGLAPGDRVAYAALPPGAYTSVRTLPADVLVPLPREIDARIAAATLLKGTTASFLLHDVHPVAAGQTVLVHAAAGGVGILLCQWASALGATVIGTVGSPEKAQLAREHGCHYPVLYREQPFAEAVHEITGGRGVDVAYDAVGKDTWAASFEALAQHGHLVSYGQASGDIGAVEIAGFASKSARISRPNYGHYTDTAAKRRRHADRLFSALRARTVRPVIGGEYPLAQVSQAHRDLESRRTSGALILRP